ncbi:alpha/beta fold hydrolase [Aliidiomarina haloalkalitolerans]|uniref:AB hydrolase-1 domain-containing protein n=1 Tax=Aliidiomarina haloalkalitolerans TaxID=859059 RepID=A0A432VXF9_9GAMM|nr:alpha/beta hydrolase [Aliidiomarina haloalkalitolerans]MCL4409972.1 alpha/beta hydrolase [Gammaproteobacteria bacterium]RUO21347.1 hypothetical protein CWE06_00260 [Aliidiomarina haloalkalitolerans]
MRAVQFNLPYIQLAGVHAQFPSTAPRTVLALHGWLDNAASFTPLLQELEIQAQLESTAETAAQPHTLDLIALDFAGHGHSDHRPQGAWYYFTEYVADVIALIQQQQQQQQWSNLELLGHSMGGYVAQLVAAALPDQVQRVTAIEAMGLWLGQGGNLVTHLQKATAQRSELRSKAAPCYKDLQRLVNLRAELNDLTPDLARLLIERSVVTTERGFEWRVDPRVRLPSPIRFTAAHAVDMLENIRCPLHVVLGDSGHNDLHQAIQNWQHHVQQLTTLTIEGGHHAHMQSPADIARILLDRAGS